ncbi:MAG: hypothetical protein AB7P20_02010 [Rhizobiaceae bacterium]
MKTTVIALAAVLALSGAAFAKDNEQNTVAAPEVSTLMSKKFIDPQTTGSIQTQNSDIPASQRLGGGIDTSVLPNF